MTDKIDLALGSLSGLGLIAYVSMRFFVESQLDVIQLGAAITFFAAAGLLLAKKYNKIF